MTHHPAVDHSTQGLAYSEFGYNEHPVTTRRFFSCEDNSVIDFNAKKVQL